MIYSDMKSSDDNEIIKVTALNTKVFCFLEEKVTHYYKMSENDFKNWCSDVIKPLLSNKPPKEDKKKVENYILSIKNTGKLPDDLISETDYFIDVFSPRFISSILQKHIKNEDAKEINEYIQLYIPLFVNFLPNPENKIVLIMKDAFTDTKWPFYTSTTSIFGSFQYFNENVKKLQDSDFLSKAIELIEKGLITPKTFYWVVEIVILLEKSPKNDLIKFSTAANSLLNSFYKSDDDEIIKEIDLSKNKECLKLFKQYSTIYKESKVATSDVLLNLVIKLATCSTLKKQFDSLVYLRDKAKKSKETREYIAKSPLFPTMIEKEIHSQLIPTFVELSSLLFRSGFLSVDCIVKLWEKFTNQTDDNMKSFMKAFNDIYSNIPEKYKRRLIKYFIKADNYSDEGLIFISNNCSSWIVNDRIDIINNMLRSFNASNPFYERAIIRLIPSDQKVCDDTLDLCINSILKNEHVEESLILYRPSSLYASPEKIRSSFATIISATSKVNKISNELVDCIFEIISNFKSNFTDDEFEAFRGFSKELMSNNGQAALDFFVKLDKKSKALFTTEMLKKLLNTTCNVKNVDYKLIKLVFKMLNKNHMDDKYYVKDPSKLHGVSQLWKYISKHLVVEICYFIANCYINDISTVIETAVKSLDNASSITVLIRALYIKEYMYSCSLFGIKRNRLESLLYVTDVTIKGDYNEKFKVQSSITFDAFIEAVCLITHSSRESLNITRSNKEKIKEKDFQLSPKEVFIVKKPYYGYSSYNEPKFEELPSFCLEKYSETLLENIKQNKGPLSTKSFLLLNELPTLPSVIEELRNGNWKEMMNTDNTSLRLYYTNSIGNLALLDETFTKQLIETGGASFFLEEAIKKSFSLYKNICNQETVLDTACYLLMKAEDKKKVIEDAGIDIVTETIKIIDEKLKEEKQIRVVEHLLVLLNEMSSACFDLIQKDETFIKLIPTLMFNKSYIVWNQTLLIISTFNPEIALQNIEGFMNKAIENNIGEYFSLLSNIAERIEKTDEIYNKVKSIIISKYAPVSDDKMAVVSFNFPPSKFTEKLFKVMTTIIQREKRVDNELFDFIINNILFNPLKYSDPPKEVFNCILCMIKCDPKLTEKILPILTQFTFEEEEHAEVKRYEKEYDSCTKKGLVNQGCTCYMNASLQQLFNVPEFRATILKAKANKTWLSKLQQLFVDMSFSYDRAANPKDFVKTWKWFGEPVIPSVQQDAVEFIQAIIDDVNTEIPGSNNVFKGKIKVETIGKGVEFRSQREEEFITFPLEVKDHSSLEESFETFLKPTILDGENQYSDEKLGKFDAEMYHRILDAPQVFILQLMRFTYNMSTNRREKIDSKYTFPRVLDLTNIMVNNTPVIYDLCGVVIHSGCAFGGHYYSYAGSGEEWYCFNDSSVSNFDPKTLPAAAQGGYSRGSAYLLFYRKRQEKVVADVKMSDDVLNSVIEDVKTGVRRQISFNEEYNKFIKDLCRDKSNPAVVLALLPRQKDITEEMKEIIKSAAKENPSFVYNRSIMKDLMLVNNRKEVRTFIAEIVSNTINETKDPKEYMEFLKENIRLSTKYVYNFDQFLIPLETAMKYGTTCKDVIYILKTLFDEIDTQISDGQSNILSVCDCSILFRLIRENIDDESKEFMEQFIRKDSVKKMRNISKEVTKIRSLCISQQSKEALLKTLDKRDPEEAADAFLVLVGIGLYQEVEVVSKRNNLFINGFLKELYNLANGGLNDFFAKETWWIKSFLIQRNQGIRRDITQVIYKSFETAPKYSSNEEELMINVSDEEKEDLLGLSENLFQFLPDAAKFEARLDSFYDNGNNPSRDICTLLTWSVVRSENYKIIAGKFDTIYSVVKKLGSLEYESSNKISEVLQMLSAIIKPNYVIPFFETTKNYIKFCNILYKSFHNYGRSSIPFLSEFIVKTDNKEFTPFIYKSNICKILVSGLRSVFTWNAQLSCVLISHLSKEMCIALTKILTNSNNTNIFVDDRYLSIAMLVREILFKCPELANKFISAELFKQSMMWLKKSSRSSFIIVASIVCVTRGNRSEFHNYFREVKENIKLSFDQKETWYFIESLLLINSDYALYSLNSLPEVVFDGYYANEKLSFFRTAVSLYKDDERVKVELHKALSKSIENEEEIVFDSWCSIVSSILDKDSSDLYAQALSSVKTATEVSFGNGLIQLTKAAERNGFDIEQICNKCYNLLLKFREKDQIPKLHKLLEFACNFPRIREEVNKLPETHIEHFKAMCAENSIEADDCKHLLSIIIK